jgi:GUN4-like
MLASRKLKFCYVLFASSLVVIVFLIWHGMSRVTNYSKLESLLKEKEWLAADKETARIMDKLLLLEVDSQHFFGYSRIDSVVFFGQSRVRVMSGGLKSCSRLQDVDNLWRKYSDNKFGFSVQSDVLASMKIIHQDSQNYQKDFRRHIGWKTYSISEEKTQDEHYKIGQFPSDLWFIKNSPKSMTIFPFLESYKSCSLQSRELIFEKSSMAYTNFSDNA